MGRIIKVQKSIKVHIDTLKCHKKMENGRERGGRVGGAWSLALSQVCLKHFGSSPSAGPVSLATLCLSRHGRCKVTAGVASMSAR